MRRADRRDANHDNAINHPRARQTEPIPPREAAQRLATLRAHNNELRQQVQDAGTQAEQTQNLYLKEQQRYQSTLTLYQSAQAQTESYLALYDEEKTKNNDLLTKYQAAQLECDRYIVLYNESQSQLKFERRSKAGIKGWETRRKRENELLKQEISEMTHLLRDSLERKEEAIDHLEELASRMDRICHVISSPAHNGTSPGFNKRHLIRNPPGLLVNVICSVLRGS
jgi:chromosome segregation ATPase